MVRAINLSAVFAVLLLTSTVDHSSSLEQVENAGIITTHVFREKAPGLLSHGAIQKEGRASAEEIHNVVFVVQHNNVDKLTRILHDVSDPSNSKYGKHLTRAEISDLTANPTARNEVLAHLKAVGASVITDSPYGDHHITASAPVSVWENMFNTEFFTYSHASGTDNTKFIRTEKYSIPQALDAHITSVFNTIQTPLSRKAKSPAAVPKTAHKKRSLAGTLLAGYTTPERINLAYGIPSNKGHPKATQAIYEFGHVSYSPQDISDFQYNMDIPDFTVNKTIGATPTTQDVCAANTEFCAEANVDLSFIMAISESPTTYYGSETSMGLWLLSVASAPNPPKVISISYGLDEIYITQAERDLFSHEAIKLGTMGVSILVASGDDGATTSRARNHPENCMYEPVFPASCPYVTTIGATQGIEIETTEIVSQNNKGGDVTSGGGFSSFYNVPDWQKAAVDGYFAKVDGTAVAPQVGYSRGGRGYPDLSMAGTRFVVIIGGIYAGIGGTSVATPSMAGIISLVNAARFTAGGNALGWLNPALYQHHAAFARDITSGRNQCTGMTTCCTQGFEATAGWDPASGLGSLDFVKFRNTMLSVAGLPVPV